MYFFEGHCEGKQIWQKGEAEEPQGAEDSWIK